MKRMRGEKQRMNKALIASVAKANDIDELLCEVVDERDLAEVLKYVASADLTVTLEVFSDLNKMPISSHFDFIKPIVQHKSYIPALWDVMYFKVIERVVHCQEGVDFVNAVRKELGGALTSKVRDSLKFLPYFFKEYIVYEHLLDDIESGIKSVNFESTSSVKELTPAIITSSSSTDFGIFVNSYSKFYIRQELIPAVKAVLKSQVKARAV